MPREFKFPDVGEGIHEGKIVKWRVKEGDSVKADEPIVDVETDKAIVELPSPVTGKILERKFSEGTSIKVGEVLVTIDEGSTEIKPTEKTTHESKPDTEPVTPKISPANLVANEEKPTEIIDKEPKTEPTMEQRVPSSMATFLNKREEEPEVQKAPQIYRALASPSTRKLARELGIDINTINGSGEAGRVLDSDLKSGTKKEVSKQTIEPTKSINSNPTSTNSSILETRTKIESVLPTDEVRVPLTGLRKAIADKMAYSKAHIPHACGMDLVDVTKLVELREKEKKIFEPRGIKLTYLPFVIKACCIALKRYPSFNAHFDNDKNQIVAKRDINIGIAVDTPEGLMAPVISNSDHRSIIELAQEIQRLAGLSKEHKLSLDEARGSTFTITNIGSIGGMFATPIINAPEVAILGVNQIRDMPWVVDGKIVIRKMMGISLCFDHRVVDGAIATEFMNVVKQHLEDPDLMIVDMG